MSTTARQTLTTRETLTETQPSTNMSFLSLIPSPDTSTVPTFTELLAEYQATISKPAVAWNALNGDPPAEPMSIDQPTRWLWPQRLPLAGINLLDGDHGTGLSLLSLRIAASVSSGLPMPDGSTTLQGGVVIVSPYTDAPTQLLTAFGANHTSIEILSTIQESDPTSHTTSTRPFSIPEDLPRLYQAIKHVNAHLVILDPFISLLSRKRRWTDQRLGHLLTDFNQQLIDNHVACIITRNCPAKGGHTRPSVLERSDHFTKVAASRLLLAPDPLYPDRLLLSHAKSRRSALTPTLTFQIQPHPDNPDLPRISILGTHSLKAKDLLDNRPDMLHRQLLFDHLLKIINDALDPIPVATLYALSPHSSAFQIQRSLSDLLRMGQIQRPTHGFYAPAPPTPIPSFKQPPATTQIAQPIEQLNSSAATTPVVQHTQQLNSSAATTQISQHTQQLNPSLAITLAVEPAKQLNPSATTTQIAESTEQLNSSAATTQIAKLAEDLNPSPATPVSQHTQQLNSSPATTPISQHTQQLNPSLAITL